MGALDENTLQQIHGVLIEKQRRFSDRSRPNEAEDQEEPSAEIIDMAQALERIDRKKSLVEQERRELVAVEHALTKITSGDFGVCEDCDEQIPPRRLMVLPEARLCARCQEFEERQQMRTRGMSASAR